MRIRLVAGLCVAVFVAPISAQSVQAGRTGTIVGSVARDSVGTMVGQAQVQLPQLNRSATTNWLGEFQFSDVPPGRYAVTVRAIGFRPLVDSLDVKPGGRVDADIILTAEPVSLATQHTTAVAVEQRLPPGLEEMRDRMKTHMGGYYVTDSTLRANNEQRLMELLGNIPALHQELSNTGAGVFLANSREPGDGGGVFASRRGGSDGTFPAGKCYINIFVDGAPYFIGPAAARNPPPDFVAIWAHDYSGVEYYPSAASVPAEYNVTKSTCGTMLLWTRRTP